MGSTVPLKSALKRHDKAAAYPVMNRLPFYYRDPAEMGNNSMLFHGDIPSESYMTKWAKQYFNLFRNGAITKRISVFFFS